MPLESGRLRHRIDIERRQDVQDPVTGATSPRWVTEYSRVPAEVAPLSAREYIAAQAIQSEISGRITIRTMPNITAKHRVRHGASVYNIAGPPLPDKDSGREYLTLLISEVDDAYETEIEPPIPPEPPTPSELSPSELGAFTADSTGLTVDNDEITADA